MFEIFGIPSTALFGQLLIGLINGSFYALLSLGLAVIFGMLNIINFSHGAQYMLGAFAAYLLLQYSGLGYWPTLVIAPVLVGITGVVVERLFLQWLYKLDHLYGLLNEGGKNWDHANERMAGMQKSLVFLGLSEF